MFPTLRGDSTLAPAARRPINRVDSFFDRVFGEDGGPMAQVSGAPVAMWADEDHLWVEVDLPGVAEEDLDLTVHNEILWIRGERKVQEGRRYLYNGRLSGRFERAIALPEAVDTDGVQASLKDGVLRIELPKSPEAKPKKIMLRTR